MALCPNSPFSDTLFSPSQVDAPFGVAYARMHRFFKDRAAAEQTQNE
jgi:hypothetical protein